MKAAFSQASLALTVNTLPAVDRRQLCYLPPRRSDAEEDLYTDIFSQSQGKRKKTQMVYFNIMQCCVESLANLSFFFAGEKSAVIYWNICKHKRYYSK